MKLKRYIEQINKQKNCYEQVMTDEHTRARALTQTVQTFHHCWAKFCVCCYPFGNHKHMNTICCLKPKFCFQNLVEGEIHNFLNTLNHNIIRFGNLCHIPTVFANWETQHIHDLFCNEAKHQLICRNEQTNICAVWNLKTCTVSICSGNLWIISDKYYYCTVTRHLVFYILLSRILDETCPGCTPAFCPRIVL